MIIIIHYLNILTNDGESLVFRNYGNADVDPDLLAGFLSVFLGLMKQNSQSEIRCTTTTEFRYFYSNIDEYIIVVCSDLEDDDATVNSKISTIRAKFVKKYGEILDSGTWTGNRAIFNEFEREIDEIILGAIKFSIIGTVGSGKSELLQLICGKDIDLEYIPTINVDITSFDGEALDVHRSIVFWDFAGQANFRSLWKSLLDSTDVVLLVLDSSFENVNQCKEILRDILKKDFNDVLIIGIANKQELPHRLTPEFCERILAEVCDPPIKVFGMITSNPVYREKIHSILRDAVRMVLEGKKPNYKLKEAPIIKKPWSQIIKPRSERIYKTIETKQASIIENKVHTFIDGKELAQFIGQNKQEIRVLEKCYNHFQKFKEDKSTDREVMAFSEREFRILTSKYILQTIIAWIYVFVLGYVFWFVWFFIPSTIEIDLTLSVIYYSFEIPVLLLGIILYILIFILKVICLRLILFAIYLKNYFIVLDAQGIYYKKIGKPKFIAWNKMSKITAKKKYFRHNYQMPNNMVITIYKQSGEKVRFNYSNYDLKQEDLFLYGHEHYLNYFAYIFRTFYYRECPLYYL